MGDGDGSEKRREGRLPARIVTQLARRGEPVELLTNNVSFKGAFIRTDAPPQLRELVRLSFKTPQGADVSVHAMVVYVVPPGDPSRVPGVGVQFWGPIDQPRAWEQFVQDLRVREKQGTLTASAVDKVRRGSERFRMTLDVTLGTGAGQTRDLSLTGMAVRTALAFEVGMRVHLSMTTPREDKLDIDVIVRRRIDEPGFKGVGVEFVDPSSSDLAVLRDIIEPLPSEVVLIDFDAPELH